MAVSDKKYEELKALLDQECKSLIVIHPDPDSLSSAWALSLLFKKNKCSADIAIYEPIKRLENRQMVKLLRIPVINFKDADLSSYAMFCLVDAQPDQFPELAHTKWDIVIDHHPTRDEREYCFSDIRPDMGATASIMAEYLDVARARVSERLATALCYGIITDTDHFQRNMTRADARAFSDLFTRANYTLLRVIEQTEIPLKQLSYFHLALQRLQVQARRVVIHIGAVDSFDIAVILADFFIRVSGIQFVVISCIANEKLIIIFRSRSMRRDAGKIAIAHFSGLGSAGGHKSAARAEAQLDRLPSDLKLYNPDAVEKFIKKRLSKPGKPSGDKTQNH